MSEARAGLLVGRGGRRGAEEESDCGHRGPERHRDLAVFFRFMSLSSVIQSHVSLCLWGATLSLLPSISARQRQPLAPMGAY